MRRLWRAFTLAVFWRPFTAIKLAYRLRYPAAQLSYCRTCSTPFIERHRRPCPVDGDLRRDHFRIMPLAGHTKSDF